MTQNSPIGVAVIGCGYWGPRLVRNFYESPEWEVIYACDRDARKLDGIRRRYPTIKIAADLDATLGDDRVEVVAIATPVSSHYPLARKALTAGRHVWLEKPMAASSREAADLVNSAKARNLLVHVDHIFAYAPPVQKLAEIVSSGALGEIMYFDSVRVNLGLFQHDVNVVWDLAPHDLSILLHCLGKSPVRISATGAAPVQYNNQSLESIAYLTLQFQDSAIAHIAVNWLSPVKIRHILLGGSQRMVVFNDLEPVEKIKIYDSGVTIRSTADIYRTLVQYRTGDMYSPKVEHREALAVECEHFAACVRGNRPSLTDGEMGLVVVRMLEAATDSMRHGGRYVSLS